MKKSQNVLRILLLGLLFVSLILNFVQGDRIEQLTKDVITLQHEQSVMEHEQFLIQKYVTAEEENHD